MVVRGEEAMTKVLLLNLTKYFNFFDTEVIPDCRLLNSFSNCIFFYSYNC